MTRSRSKPTTNATKDEREQREGPKRTLPLPTLRDAILAELVEVEETEYAKGFNHGLRGAVHHIDVWIETTSNDAADINQLSLDDLRIAYLDLRDRYAAKITEALAELRAAGKKTGGDVPYGYRVGSNNMLIENKREQAVIDKARQLKAAGYSLRGIAKALWDDNVRARSVNDGRKKDGRKDPSTRRRPGEFAPFQISRLLAEPDET